MIPASDMRLGEGIFTHVNADGTNTHIASNRLHDWAQKAPLNPVMVPVEPQMARRFLTENVISPARVKVLASRKNLTPIILAKDGTFTNGRPDVFFVDGHHRYFLYAALGKPLILAYVLELEQWTPFQITGLPNTTRERLMAQPITERAY